MFSVFVFGYDGSSVLHRLFSSCSKWGLHSSCDAWASHCGGLLLRSTGSSTLASIKLRPMGSVVVAPGLQGTGSVVVTCRLSCSVACRILLDQGSNPGLMHWRADSSPLSHQGNLEVCLKCRGLAHAPRKGEVGVEATGSLCV